jgi:GntR family transcriptional regulator
MEHLNNVLPDSSVPLYIQLKELLQEAMGDGTLPPGSRVPSERELSQRYNVSRMTARQALQMLAHEGLIYSRVGKGTYVSEPKIPQELQALTSFTEEMARLGMRAESKVLRAEVLPATQDVARRLSLPSGALVVALLRVRYAGGEPMALENTFIDHSLCPDILENHDFSTDSLYEVMRSEYGLSVVLAEQLIETRLPQTNECDALGIDHLTPILSIERTTFDADDRAIEFVRSVYRGDKYRFRTVLRAQGWVAAPVKDLEA